MSSTIEESKNFVDQVDFESLRKIGIDRTVESFYILGNYPPLTAMDPLSGETLLEGNQQNELDVYLHFQFCEQLCNFCHFQMDQRARSHDDPRVVRYLGNLKREISMLSYRLGRVKARSVYIGGGTPSFMSVRQIEDLFAHLNSEFTVPSGTIVTFDVHPEILRFGFDEKVEAFQRIGVNRIAMGGVDLNDRVLQTQQRGHSSKETLELITSLKLKGMPHVTADMMVGLPGQTMTSWERTLDLLIENEIDSAMVYPLMFKASQINWRQYQRDPSCFPTIRDKMIMQLLAMRKFEDAGYKQAPVYYFNREEEHANDQQLRKFESLNESGLLAIGLSSFGYLNGCQYFNTTNVNDYHAMIESGRLPVWRGTQLSDRHKFERDVMFSLKSRGIDKKEISERYGLSVDVEYGPIIQELESANLVESDSKKLKLTRLGILFAEEICDKFAGEEIRRKAERIALTVDPKHPLQRFNYNMIGHRLK